MADRPGSGRLPNPYKGPIAYEEKDADYFFGRDRDAQALTALTVSERLVLFCARSGAGKTSLINARLVPELRDLEFNVLPPVRVSGEIPRKLPANVYTYCALKALNRDHHRLDETLDGYLRTQRDGDPRPRVLILDQFEEILSSHAEHWEHREPFFLQLRQAMADDSSLSVLLVMREDRIAGLERYIPLVSGHLRARFRMERLRHSEAVEAIEGPAQKAGHPFATGVASRLARDLCQVHIADKKETITGEFAEPVHLQVACFQLWEKLREKLQKEPGCEITEDDLTRCGDVDDALESFYESTLERAHRESGVSRTRLRRWCENRLITPSLIRAQVPKERSSMDGLSNKAVDVLAGAHLIWTEEARGGTWYELAHDRLIEPILASNRKAEGLNRKSSLSSDARAWKDSGQDASFLYQGKRLAKALQSKSTGLSELEQEFLDAAQAAVRDRKNVLLKSVIAGLSIIVISVALLAFYIYRQSRESVSRELAMGSILKLESDPELSLRLALEALDRSPSPEAEAALHQALTASTTQRRWSAPAAAESASALALSPDGARIAAVGHDGRVVLLDAESGQRVLSGPRVESTVTTVAFHPGGSSLAIGDIDGHVLLWGLGDEYITRRFELGTGINHLTFSPDGRRLAVASDDPVPVVLDLATGEPALSLKGHQRRVWDIAFSRDGRFLATGSADNSAIVWDARSGALLRTFPDHDQEVTGVDFSPQGELATSSFDTSVMTWSLNSGAKLHTFYGHRDSVWDVAFSPDGQYLATASDDGTVRLWQSNQERRPLRTLTLDGPAQSVAFSPRQGELAIVAKPLRREDSGSVALWKILFRDVPTLAQGAGVTAIAFDRGGTRLASGDNQGRVLLWSRDGRRVARLKEKGGEGISAVSFDSRGETLAASFTGGVRLWRLSPLREITGLLTKGQINALAFSPDDRLLATAGTDGRVLLWDLATKRAQVLAQGKPVLAVAFDPAGQYLATAGAASEACLWDVASSRRLRTFKGHGSVILSLAFSADGKRLVTGSGDKTARLWDVGSGNELAVLSGHSGSITEVAFSPAGQRVATGSTDRTVKIWEAGSGRELFTLSGHLESISGLDFSPAGSGNVLATASHDETIRLEPMDLDELIRIAEERKPRALNPQEERIYLHR